MTLRGQIEVKHISEGCNFETLADGALLFSPLSNSLLPYSLSLSPNQIRGGDGIVNWAPGPLALVIPSPLKRGDGILLFPGFIYTIIIPSPSRGWDLVLAWFHVHYYSSSSSSSSSCRSDPWLRLWPSTQDI